MMQLITCRRLHFVMTGVVALLLLFSFAPMASAQQAAGLRVQPATIEEPLNPGDTYTGTLRATNLSTEAGDYFVLKRNVKSISATGSPIFAERGEVTGFEVADWIQLGRTAVRIEPRQTVEIPFVIRVPKNATPGAHLGGIYVSTTSDEPTETGIGIGFQVGPIVNIRVAGDVIEEARIRSFNANKFVFGGLPVTLLTKIENLGNVTVSPRGPIDVMDFAGKKVATLKMNDLGAAVLPKSQRDFEVTWDEPGFYIGRFQAVMSLVYGQEARKTITQTTTFWVLPPKLVLSVVGGIVGFILLVFIWMKLQVRKHARPMRRRGAPPRRGKVGYRKRRGGGLFGTAATLSVVVLIGFALLILL